MGGDSGKLRNTWTCPGVSGQPSPNVNIISSHLITRYRKGLPYKVRPSGVRDYNISILVRCSFTNFGGSCAPDEVMMAGGLAVKASDC